MRKFANQDVFGCNVYSKKTDLLRYNYTQTDTHTPIKYLALTLSPVITLTDPRGIVTAARVGTISTTQTELTVRVIVEAR